MSPNVPSGGGIPPFDISRLYCKEPNNDPSVLISGIKLNQEGGGDAPEAYEEGELSEQEMDLDLPRPDTPPPATSSLGTSPEHYVTVQKSRRNETKRR